MLSVVIKKLIERFVENRASYSASTYNETQLRREFLDPFFEALGWDVANKQGYAEAYKEVIHEDAIKIGTTTKAPDYSFRVGGTRKFFVEAKKPFINIKDDIDPAFQLRRYAWSAKLPLSILTDFEEFSVYDCRQKPNKSDKASVGRILYIKFDEYEKRWEEIASVFSKDAVLKGHFDRYAETSKVKKGTTEVDDAFLAEIEDWRDILARNIAIRNDKLSPRELNFSVQRTIDRLIFLRICEDRGIEDYGRLQAHLNGENIYKRLCVLFRGADERYNSGLFHFREEKGRDETPDNITLKLDIDDKVLKQIIQNLYYPDSAYEFSVLPADILGQVYEQFLGKVIRLTAGHQAKVEDKPEVKKAGGVFYTPTYIVDYIVKNTVGNLLEGKTPKQAASLRILDPACGSGSFLIGAYQYLLDWHRDWYTKNNPEKWLGGKNPAIYKARAGEYRLATPERKKILLNNIYGVDIDTQAVEVTKLSLLLKVLEGENEQTISQQLKLWHERALPDLGNNIKCGNSLIGTDFYEGTQLGMFEDEEKFRVNAFDWDGKDGFQEIMKNGGFDAVIGNPPYIRIQALKEWTPREVDFYKKRYKSANTGNYDIYVIFVEKGLSLLKAVGKLGFILPHKFFNSQYGASLREIISTGKHLLKIVHFGDQQVFTDATTYTCLLFLSKSPNNKFDYLIVKDIDIWSKDENIDTTKINSDLAKNPEWNFAAGPNLQIVEKLRNNKQTLGTIASRLAQGIRTSANEVYVLDVLHESSRHYTANSKILNKEIKIEKGIVNCFLQGRDIKKYRIVPSKKIVIIPYRNTSNSRCEFISEDEMTNEFPLAYKYFLENKTYLENREHGRMRGNNWYGYVYPKNIEVMHSKKILVPDIADRAAFSIDENGSYTFTSGYGIILNENVLLSEKYILGLLNSKLLFYFLTNISTTMRGGFFRYFSQYLEQLPIKSIDVSSHYDKTIHDQIVEFVNAMLNLHKRLPVAKTAQEKTILQRQIDSTDRRIDELVYELYGLTDEEIKIVEDAENRTVKE